MAQHETRGRARRGLAAAGLAIAMAATPVSIEVVWLGSANAAEDLGNDRNQDDLLRDIARTKGSVLDAIRMAIREDEVPLYTKFERDNNDIVLSVYVAERSGRDAEHNTFKEYRGRLSNGNDWRPRAVEFDDYVRNVRSAEYYTLLSMSPFTLEDIYMRVRDDGDLVLWIQPRVTDGRPVFEVGMARDERIVTEQYDLMDGQRR